MTPAISVQNLTVAFGDNTVLNDVSLDIPSHKITAIIGTNGCGKSTLLRCINGLITPQSGTVEIMGKPTQSLPPKQRAKQVAFLEQKPHAPQEMTLLNLVKLGRYCHQNMMQNWTETDQEQVENALRQTGLWDIQHRRVSDVSGGQLQRAWWALCLVQDSDIFLLDEPINHLDIAYQLDCLERVADLNQNHQKTVVMVLHDINLAMRYADYLIALDKNGTVYTHGTPKQTMTPKLFADVFGVQGDMVQSGSHKIFVPTAHTLTPQSGDTA